MLRSTINMYLTHTHTVSLVVIMFELTGGLSYIVPIMVAVMISKWVGDALFKDGMYLSSLCVCVCHYVRKRALVISLTSFSVMMHTFISMATPISTIKEEFTDSSLACDVMHPRQGGPPLTAVDLLSGDYRQFTTDCRGDRVFWVSLQC